MSSRHPMPMGCPLMEQCPSRGIPSELPIGGSSGGSWSKGHLGSRQRLVSDEYIMGFHPWEDGYLREDPEWKGVELCMRFKMLGM